jgi:CheY-like chemotaxis protein
VHGGPAAEADIGEAGDEIQAGPGRPRRAVEDQERALAAGFQRYLAKPVDPAALASIVRALVVDPAPSGIDPGVP